MVNDIQSRIYTAQTAQATSSSASSGGILGGTQIQGYPALGESPIAPVNSQNFLAQLMQPLMELLSSLVKMVTCLFSGGAGGVLGPSVPTISGQDGVQIAPQQSETSDGGGGIWSTIKSAGNKLLGKFVDGFSFSDIIGTTAGEGSGILGWIKNLF
jgi:hypothetical protein